MRSTSMLARPLLLACLVVTVASSLATADHVPPSLPLTSMSNHAHEKLDNQVFPPANLFGITLSFADLSNSTFSPGTDLTFSSFVGANLTNANLAGANIDNANFQGANLTNAILPCVGGADFRGAILTGAVTPPGCPQCQSEGPNTQDQCTVGAPAALCLTTGEFRGWVVGVVFVDANSNGVLDFGEQGLSGVQLNIAFPGGSNTLVVTGSRGTYGFFHNMTGPGSVTLITSTLPGNVVLNGSPTRPFDLNQCRSAQEIDYATFDPSTPVHSSTWGRLKILYR